MRRMVQRVLVGVVALAASATFTASAMAADAPPEIPLTIENNRFLPDEVRVKAATPFVLIITNKDGTAAEFESKELRVEKVVPAGKTVKVRIRALKPGTYPFADDFHKQTTGRLVAE
jgi:Cupredoxin-like domain